MYNSLDQWDVIALQLYKLSTGVCRDTYGSVEGKPNSIGTSGVPTFAHDVTILLTRVTAFIGTD